MVGCIIVMDLYLSVSLKMASRMVLVILYLLMGHTFMATCLITRLKLKMDSTAAELLLTGVDLRTICFMEVENKKEIIINLKELINKIREFREH